MAAWRAWCAGPEAKLVPIQSNGNTYRMAGFIAVFGCTTRYACVWMFLFMGRSITMTDTDPWYTIE